MERREGGLQAAGHAEIVKVPCHSAAVSDGDVGNMGEKQPVRPNFLVIDRRRRVRPLGEDGSRFAVRTHDEHRLKDRVRVALAEGVDRPSVVDEHDGDGDRARAVDGAYPLEQRQVLIDGDTTPGIRDGDVDDQRLLLNGHPFPTRFCLTVIGGLGNVSGGVDVDPDAIAQVGLDSEGQAHRRGVLDVGHGNCRVRSDRLVVAVVLAHVLCGVDHTSLGPAAAGGVQDAGHIAGDGGIVDGLVRPAGRAHQVRDQPS